MLRGRPLVLIATALLVQSLAVIRGDDDPSLAGLESVEQGLKRRIGPDNLLSIALPLGRPGPQIGSVWLVDMDPEQRRLVLG
jgi:hypothetical protein